VATYQEKIKGEKVKTEMKQLASVCHFQISLSSPLFSIFKASYLLTFFSFIVPSSLIPQPSSIPSTSFCFFSFLFPLSSFLI